MGNNDREEMNQPLISFVVVDSRSDEHLDWVLACLDSIQKQNILVELIVVNNVGKKKSIGKCYNQGVQEAKCDLVAFVGDDDYANFDLAETLWRWFNDEENKRKNIVRVSTYMFAFDDETGNSFPLAREWTGCWKRDYLLEHPFNETLARGVDRELVEETQKRNDLMFCVKYYCGYYYRKHSDYSCAGDIVFTLPEEQPDYYFVSTNRIFLEPITNRLENVFVDANFHPQMAENAKVVWCEWANKKAIDVSNTKLKAKKILRIHAFEAFTEYAHEINWNGFDHVIFINDYIKDYVERQFGKVNGAVVIPNGVDLNRFRLTPKSKNNKIAYAGYLTRKKGIGELLFIAKSLPEYEFHLAGKYQENDIADWVKYKKPDNVFVYPWQYDEAMNDFYQDKSFILNTSLRESQAMTLMEGMACGLKPLVADWIGAEEIYGQCVYKNIEELKKLLEGSYEPEKYRAFVKENYDFESTYKEIEKLFEVEEWRHLEPEHKTI